MTSPSEGRPWKLEIDGEIVEKAGYRSREPAMTRALNEARRRRGRVTVVDMTDGVENERIDVDPPGTR